jgi:DNA repair exonuclease SbcCD ATPase subunit
MTNLEEDPQSDFARELEEVETSLRFLKGRYTQVQKDELQKAQWQQELKNLKQNRKQTPEIKAELNRIQKQLETLEINLESQLFSWSTLKRPFWQAIRFGGLGVIIGWLLKSWVG